MQLVRQLGEIRQAEAKEKLVIAAFVAHQMGAAGKRTFGEYLKNLGLSDESSQQEGSQSRVDGSLARMGVKPKGSNN